MRPSLSALVRAGIAALKRLDTLMAAAVGGFCAGSVAQARFCADLSCKSVGDTAIYYAVVLAGGVGLGVLLWRYTHRWWARVLVVPISLYALLILPPAVWAQGRWSVTRGDGIPCAVRASMTSYDVHTTCGDPAVRCAGPKYVQSESVWNPLDILVCQYEGDVYADRIITYDCRGRVYSVVAFTPVPGVRPPGCVY